MDFGSLYSKLFKYTLSERCHAELIEIWNNILKSRLFEEKIVALVKFNKIKKCWLFSGIGQEGGSSAICSMLKKGDYLLPSVRGCCQVISRGFPLEPIAAEVLSRKTGIMGGQGPCFSFTAPEYGIYQHADTVGIDLGTIVGMGIDLARKNEGNIAVIFFGDGAATRGLLWSALNLSIIWKLPILWVCDNNQYAITTLTSKIFPAPLHKVASSFGIKAKCTESNDVIASYVTAKKMIDLVRKKSMPAFLELKTYRIMSHDLFFMTDQSYQNSKEISYWRSRDPLLLLEKRLLEAKLITKEHVFSVREKTQKEIDDAFKKAEKDPELKPEEILNQKI